MFRHDDYQPIIRIHVVGNKSCGKRSLLTRLADNVFDDERSQFVEFKHTSVQLADQLVRVSLYINDENLESFSKSLADSTTTHAVIMLCDLGQNQSLENLKSVHEKIRKLSKNIPIYLIATKNDLEIQQVSEQDLKIFPRDKNTYKKWQLVSAKTGENVQLAIAELTSHIMHSIHQKNLAMRLQLTVKELNLFPEKELLSLSEEQRRNLIENIAAYRGTQEKHPFHENCKSLFIEGLGELMNCGGFTLTEFAGLDKERQIEFALNPTEIRLFQMRGITRDKLLLLNIVQLKELISTVIENESNHYSSNMRASLTFKNPEAINELMTRVDNMLSESTCSRLTK